jgi:hypothetical protein
VLHGSAMPNTTVTMYLQGTVKILGGQGTVFGDGLRCVTGQVIRLGLETNVGGASSYGGPEGDIPISVRGNLPASGGTRYYQAWYRNAASFCTSNTFNLSNGLEIVWLP